MNTLHVRPAAAEDFERILEIYAAAREIMRHLLDKYGFTRCGIIYVADGTPRIAYQKLYQK